MPWIVRQLTYLFIVCGIVILVGTFHEDVLAWLGSLFK